MTDPSADCLSAREAASSRLDGELAPLDDARLDAHLLGCAPCRLVVAELGAIARELREATLEQPGAEHPGTLVVFPLRRRSPVAFRGAAAASVAAAVVACSFALGQVMGSQSTPAPAAAFGQTDAALRLRQDSTRQHLLALLGAVAFTRHAPAPMRAI